MSNEVEITRWADGSIRHFSVWVRDFLVHSFEFPEGSTPISELSRLTNDFFTNAMDSHNRNIDSTISNLGITEEAARELYGRTR